MFKIKCTLLIGLLALLDSTWGSIGVPNYPSSGGLSGNSQGNGGLSGSVGQSSGGHGYPPAVSRQSYPPSSSVQSNSVYPGSHSYYPASNQKYNNSSVQRHSYTPTSNVRANSSHHVNQSFGNRHTYPSTTPRYVYPSPKNNRNYTQRHTYPSTTVRTTGGKISDNSGISWHPAPTTSTHSSSHSKIKVHHVSSSSYNNGNYYYKPPKQITHNPRHGGPSVKYPVYQGELPSYIYQYRGSRSRYRKLLAGLALMNLGTLGAASTTTHKSSAYTKQPKEVCKLVIKRDTNYEATLIDCKIISSFISEGMQLRQSQNVSSLVKQTVTVSSNPPIMLSNGTLIDAINGYDIPQYIEPGTSGQYDMLPNGTLVLKGSAADRFGYANGKVVSSILASSEIKDAINVRGEPVEVNSKMECFVIMIRPTWNMRKWLPCRLLEIYSDSSLHSSAVINMPSLVAIVAFIVAYIVAY